ncbi:MAG: heparan-alpha-glucosaminide N-acetyltransferase domain-containing protein [Myxococcota bacterium]
MSRLAPLDGLRGTIVALMALDHASAFIARPPERVSEFWAVSFPVYTEPLPFLVRVVTHLCAPGFFLLMGASVALFAADRARRGWSESTINRALWIRAGLLVIFQQIPVNLGWLAGSGSGGAGHIPGTGGDVLLYFGVLWGLGSAMAIVTTLRRLPAMALVVLALLCVVGVAFLLPTGAAADAGTHPLLRLLLVPGQTGLLMVRYPTLPWLGLALLGMLFGRRLVQAPEQTMRASLPLGLAAIGGFVVVRLLGGVGNLRPPADGWIGFFNVVKYPPSVAYQLLTVGVNLLLMRWFVHAPPGRGPIGTFGRTALFFYLIHLFVFAALSIPFRPDGTGVVGMLPLWILGLAILFPLCRWFDGVKRRAAPEAWVRYL